MRTNPLRYGLALGGALTLLAFAVPAQAQTIWACYVPNTGTIYRVMTEDTRTQCASPQHVLFSWEAQVVEGPPETPEPPGEEPLLAEAEYEGNDVLHLNVTNTGVATTALEGEVDGAPLFRLRNTGGPPIVGLPQVGLRVEGSAEFKALDGGRLLDIDGDARRFHVGAQNNLFQPHTGESSVGLLVRTANGFDLLRVNTQQRSVRVGPAEGDASFRVSGASSFEGNAAVQGDLSVGGVLSGNGVLAVEGPVSVDGDVLRVVPGIRRVAIGSDALVPEGNARLDVHGKTTVQTNVAPAFEVLPLSGLESAVFQVLTSPARRVHVDGELFVANAGSGMTGDLTTPPLGLTANSHISVTLTGDPGGRLLRWVEKDVAQQQFRAHLTGGGPSVPFTYQVIEPFK